MTADILCIEVFSLSFFKFDLYLLKQSTLRALKRDLERVYLMIVGKSLCFIPQYRRLRYKLPARVRCETPKNDSRHFMH